MRFRFRSLVLDTPRRQEFIDLDHQFAFFHGQVSAGKSSILRLIDYCLGGDLELTVAIQKRLVSATLSVRIGENDVLLEREKPTTEQVRVTWTNRAGEVATVLAPLRPASTPIWDGGIHSLSDLLFFLSGTVPMKVRRSKLNPDSELIRLSFRNLMWYCYLQQELQELSFYNLENPERKFASRDVLRYALGYYTDRQTELEVERDRSRLAELAKRQSVGQMRTLMAEMGYDSPEAVARAYDEARAELESAKAAIRVIESDRAAAVHPAEALRRKLRDLSQQIDVEERALIDVARRIEQQTALRAELVSSKFKMARAVVATSLLGNVEFHSCPRCGTGIHSPEREAIGDCVLCKQPTQVVTHAAVTSPASEAERADINNRIDEIAENLKRHREARRFQEKRLEALLAEKTRGDQELSRQLVEYDSAYVAALRQHQTRAATAEERARNIEQARRLPEKIAQLEREADEHMLRQEQLRREIEAERSVAARSEGLVRRLEEYYHEALLAVHVPHVNVDDKVSIDPRDWIPRIYPAGDSESAWEFARAGSGGKKTLMNACFALAIHRLAAEEGLRLPSFLMIDTPMKNIGERVNEDLLKHFYAYLYRLAAGPLRETQFIIGDIQFVPPPAELGLDLVERFMTREDPRAPPLFTDYVGP